METLAPLNPSVAAAIGWFYLVTNSARVFTYIPQIIAVWRCRDGARAISLITWYSWAVSHAAAMTYGALVVHDGFFFVISAINFACSSAVATIATQRRSRFSVSAESHAATTAPPQCAEARPIPMRLN